MILLLSRAETLALILVREGLIWSGDVGQLWRPEPPDHETQAMQDHQAADRRQQDRQHRGGKERSAGMLEMSRRVGGAESRCQAQSVRSCAGRPWAGWMGPPSRSSIFVVKEYRRRPIFENLPMFPAQEPAGGHRRSFHRCSDRGRSLGPLCVFLRPGNGSLCLHPCRATRCLRGRWCESCV